MGRVVSDEPCGGLSGPLPWVLCFQTHSHSPAQRSAVLLTGSQGAFSKPAFRSDLLTVWENTCSEQLQGGKEGFVGKSI